MRDNPNDYKEWDLVETFPAELTFGTPNLQKRLMLNGPPTATLHIELVSFGGFLITRLEFSTPDQVECSINGAGETMGMFFNLRGVCSGNKSGQRWEVGSGQQNIYHAYSFNNSLNLSPENGQVEFLEINFPVDFYRDLFAGFSKIQDRFLDEIAKKQLDPIEFGASPMTMPMKWLINTIRGCTRTGVLKRLFLESKILELLMLQVEAAEKTMPFAGSGLERLPNIERLHEARDIIDRNIDTPPTIRILARQIGINEFHLKKGFKELFGTTIYGYVNKVKMEQARQMILEGEKSISEISLISGYRNPQHFTAAFKRYFGTLPSKAR